MKATNRGWWVCKAICLASLPLECQSAVAVVLDCPQAAKTTAPRQRSSRAGFKRQFMGGEIIVPDGPRGVTAKIGRAKEVA
jgi:hypothetical protein